MVCMIQYPKSNVLLKDLGKLFVMQQLFMVMLFAQVSLFLFIITCKLPFKTIYPQFNSFVSRHFRGYLFCLLCFVIGYAFLFWGCGLAKL